MCGISGIYHFNNSATTNEQVVVKMRDTLIHRGPDSAGLYISKDGKIGLGHRRLAIIDLSPAGHQPMTNENGSIWITYNGEIYNFQQIRPELEKRGHIFRSKSDTEVIIHAYEEYGFECLQKFNGMFAFVIWDERKQILFASRDHLGIKPFYYALQNGTFYFGSEIKAILAHPDFKKDLDENNISHYLTFSCLPAPFTLFKNVKKLPPAHFLIIDSSGNVRQEEYWNPVAEASLRYGASPVAKTTTYDLQPTTDNNEEYYVSEIRKLLKDSIKSQMVSDVPFGCFLSGGVDSSTNAALMSEALGKPVETFSVGSKEFEKYNEFQYSRKLAKTLGAKIHEIVIDEKHFLEFLPKFAYHFDDPNGDQVCLPLFWLAKLTRDSGVIVIQIGEGSDEIFTGYDTYIKAANLYNSWWQWLEKLPEFIRKSLWSGSLIINHPRFDFYKEYLRRLKDHQEPFWGNAIAFGDYQKEKLLTPQFKNSLSRSSYSIIENYYNEIKGIDNKADFLKHLTYLELKHRLPELLLMRADKMTMAHSVEGRVPFLDHRLVELAFQIPTAIKIKNNTSKYILKKAVEGIIPSEIIWRKKQGFATPMSEWLKPESPISKELINIIFQSKLRERNLLNYDYIKKLVYSHQRQNTEHNFRIWNLITLSLWYDYWFK